MPSFTSSSDVRLLRANWRQTWVATVLLVLIMAGAWEVFWRLKGYRPVINDDARLWGAARQSVEPESIVLVGSSRMHGDVHPAYFKEVTGQTPIQLSINGGWSYRVLQNLAQDVSFHGTVVCEMWEKEMASDPPPSSEKGIVESYKQQTVAELAEGRMRRFTQKYFTSALPQLAPFALIADIEQGHWPTPSPPYHIGEDRSFQIDFTRMDLQKLRQDVARASTDQGPNISPDEFVARARRFEDLAEQIEKRGGQVILVRLPVSGVLWDRLEETYPKMAYWDAFARQTHHPALHFKDYPELQFECVDYSHLDRKDVPQFSRALAKILWTKGLIKRD